MMLHLLLPCFHTKANDVMRIRDVSQITSRTCSSTTSLEFCQIFATCAMRVPGLADFVAMLALSSVIDLQHVMLFKIGLCIDQV